MKTVTNITAFSGNLAADAIAAPVVVTYSDDPKGYLVDGLGKKDVLTVVHKNGAGTGWVPLTVRDDRGQVHPVVITADCPSVFLNQPDTYSLQSTRSIAGSVTIYTVENG